MKKILPALLLAILILTASFAICESTEILNVPADAFEHASSVLLPDLMIGYALPNEFVEIPEEETGDILYYFMDTNQLHALIFLKTSYASLEDAKGLYGEVTYNPVRINGLQGIDYLYTRTTGEVVEYTVDAYIDNGYGQIFRYYEVTLNPEDGIGKYEAYIMPVSIEGQPSVSAAGDTGSETSEANRSEITGSEVAILSADSDNASLPEAVPVLRQRVQIQDEDDVNVRALPSADSEKVGTAAAGGIYVILETAENGWYKIEIDDGITGYVSPKVASLYLTAQ